MSVAIEGAPAEGRRVGVARIAERLGVTEGQVYTVAIGLVIGLVTAAIGIPPTLRDNPGLRAVLQQGPPADSRRGGSSSEPASPSTGDVAAPSAGSYAAPSISSGTGSASSSGSFSSESNASGSGGSASFADGGKLGDVERLTTVGSPGAPSGVAVDSDGGFFVATDNGGSLGEPGPSKVLHYSASGSLVRTYTISGQPQSHARGLSAVVLDGEGHLYALDASTARVLRIDVRSGEQTDAFTLPDVRPCALMVEQCEPSPADNKPLPQAAALTPTGDLLVADAGQGIVWKVDEFGGSTLWDSSPDYVSPDIGPSGLAVDADGSVLLAVSKSVVGLGGAIYRILGGSDGKAGTHTKVYGTEANSTPNGIAVGSSGRIYVALTGSNSLLVLDKAGVVVRKIASPAFSKPFGLAFRGNSLLLTNQAPAAGEGPSSWSVLRLAAEDRAATG
jgi:sugar lactone lactonase YvrE